jgi:hypothetical protein
VDHQNLLAARSGDRAALATLLRALQDSWFRFCLALLRNADQARDATQETGLRFIRTFGTFRGDSQLQTWSLGIALNVVREMRRKNRPLPDEGHAFREAVRSEAECPSEAVALSEQRARCTPCWTIYPNDSAKRWYCDFLRNFRWKTPPGRWIVPKVLLRPPYIRPCGHCDRS